MEVLRGYGAGDSRLEEAYAYPAWELARVTSQYKDKYRIITEKGEYLAQVSGKYRYSAGETGAYPTVGDFVMADCAAEDAALIHCVLRRKSVFSRTAAGGTGAVQLVAANVDIVFVCMSLNRDYNLSRLERYLSVAWSSGATPVVVLTKADLCEDAQRLVEEARENAPGVDVLVTSALDESACKLLLPYLKPGVTASFIGSSGVGKSTLINRLAGGELLDTGDVRASDDRGRHTSTRRELIVLESGGIVIDTPGMRELGVETVEVDLARSFSDIEALAEGCRFRDCSHTIEPGCAVKRALEAGELDARRFENYLKLKRESGYGGLSSRQLEQKKLNGMFAAVGGMKNVRKYIKQNDKRNGD